MRIIIGRIREMNDENKNNNASNDKYVNNNDNNNNKFLLAEKAERLAILVTRFMSTLCDISSTIWVSAPLCVTEPSQW